MRVGRKDGMALLGFRKYWHGSPSISLYYTGGADAHGRTAALWTTYGAPNMRTVYGPGRGTIYGAPHLVPRTIHCVTVLFLCRSSSFWVSRAQLIRIILHAARVQGTIITFITHARQGASCARRRQVGVGNSNINRPI